MNAITQLEAVGNQNNCVYFLNLNTLNVLDALQSSYNN